VKRPAVLLALALLLIPSALLSYRIIWLGYPVFPTAPGRTWQLTIDARVKADRGEITVALGLPQEQAGRMVVEERMTSGTLSFNLIREGPNRMGVWEGPTSGGEEAIAYQSTILVRPQRVSKVHPPQLQPYPLAFNISDRTLAGSLVKKWSQLSPPARLRAIAATVGGDWGDPKPNGKDLQAWSVLRETHGQVGALLLLFRAAELPARTVEGLRLVQTVRETPLTWLEVWTGKEWESLWPETGEMVKTPSSLLPLRFGGLPAAQVAGGEFAGIRWTLHRHIVSQWRLHFERISRSERWLDRWSLFRLPPQFQETFRILLLVPFGALMIGVLRNLVGFPTFGIFMPVLMALAFRNTGLAYGLTIFGGVLLLGYAVRRSLERLRLLLVPRMSVLLTLVIASFMVIALIGNRLGLREFMAVGLLPFVILVMTIERFFILIEEAGVREGIRTAAGSAAVAAITYQIIRWEPLQLTFFVYPELLSAVAAVQVLLGRYTGYRLSEILRFRTFRGSP